MRTCGTCPYAVAIAVIGVRRLHCIPERREAWAAERARQPWRNPSLLVVDVPTHAPEDECCRPSLITDPEGRRVTAGGEHPMWLHAERDEEIERLLGLLRRALPWIGHRPVSLTSAEHDVADIIRDVRDAVEGEP